MLLDVRTLADCGRAVERELRFSATVTEWKVDLYATIEREYQQLLGSRAWPWLRRKCRLYAFPDCAVTPTLLPGSTRRLELTGAQLRANGLYPSEGLNHLLVQAAMAGGELHVTNPAALAALGANWSQAPFVIERVVASEVVPNISLDPRATINLLDGEEDLELRFPRLLLPPDCAELLAVYDDTGAPLEALNPEQFGRAALNEDDVGTPGWVVDDPGFVPRLPAYPLDIQADRFDQAQRDNMIVLEHNLNVTLGGAGTWPAGTWEVSVAWKYSGRIGPLSEPFAFTTAASQTVTLTGLPALDSNDYGRQLVVFVRNTASPGLGAPYYNATRADQTVTTLALPTPVSTKPWSRVRYDDVAGEYSYVRLYPRSDRFRRLVVEYRIKPRPLLEATDEPLIPRQHRALLVWLACRTLAPRGDVAFANRCELYADRALKALIGTTDGAYRIQKGMIGAAPASRLPFIHAGNLRYTP